MPYITAASSDSIECISVTTGFDFIVAQMLRNLPLVSLALSNLIKYVRLFTTKADRKLLKKKQTGTDDKN